MNGLLLAALLSQTVPDAGQTPVLTLASLYVACPDAPFAVAVDGGYFVPELRQRRENCQLAACENYVTPKLAEESGAPASPGLVFGLVGGGVGLLVAGILIGFFAHGNGK